MGYRITFIPLIPAPVTEAWGLGRGRGGPLNKTGLPSACNKQEVDAGLQSSFTMVLPDSLQSHSIAFWGRTNGFSVLDSSN